MFLGIILYITVIQNTFLSARASFLTFIEFYTSFVHEKGKNMKRHFSSLAFILLLNLHQKLK